MVSCVPFWRHCKSATSPSSATLACQHGHPSGVERWSRLCVVMFKNSSEAILLRDVVSNAVEKSLSISMFARPNSDTVAEWQLLDPMFRFGWLIESNTHSDPRWNGRCRLLHKQKDKHPCISFHRSIHIRLLLFFLPKLSPL